jgi:hypothetical protein
MIRTYSIIIITHLNVKIIDKRKKYTINVSLQSWQGTVEQKKRYQCLGVHHSKLVVLLEHVWKTHVKMPEDKLIITYCSFTITDTTCPPVILTR